MAAEFKEGTMNEDKQNYVRRVVEPFQHASPCGKRWLGY